MAQAFERAGGAILTCTRRLEQEHHRSGTVERHSSRGSKNEETDRFSRGDCPKPVRRFGTVRQRTNGRWPGVSVRVARRDAVDFLGDRADE